MKRMNQRTSLSTGVKAVVLVIVLVSWWLPATAAPGAKTNEVAPPLPRSIFTQPANPQEGRDPFFPSSIRPYQGVPVPGAHASTDVGALIVQGFSGTPDHRLVIINNVTFAVGDDAEVSTSRGRIHIHCLEIGDNLAVIEANGERHELRYGQKP